MEDMSNRANYVQVYPPAAAATGKGITVAWMLKTIAL